jgi:hypothetical protein
MRHGGAREPAAAVGMLTPPAGWENGDVRRILQAVDDALEQLATLLYGPQPLGYRPRPSLWTKLAVFGLLGLLILLGLVGRWL